MTKAVVGAKPRKSGKCAWKGCESRKITAEILNEGGKIIFRLCVDHAPDHGHWGPLCRPAN